MFSSLCSFETICFVGDALFFVSRDYEYTYPTAFLRQIIIAMCVRVGCFI